MADGSEAELARLREQVDRVDDRIVDLLNQRAALSLAIGQAKRDVTPGANYVPAREADIYTRLAAVSAGPLTEPALKAVYSEILSVSRTLQAPLAVAFLGPEGTFSHQAARRHFGGATTLLPVRTIADVFSETEVGRSQFGIVPIENSSEGAVIVSLDSFVDTALKACAEVRLEVHQAVMSRAPLGNISVVYSHPQAIGQCQNWLRVHLPGVPVIETASTVGAAERAAKEPTAAAIGPEVAAKIYGLEVLESRTEDIAGNVTRFLVLGRHMGNRTGRDRMALLFSIKDRVGVLRDVLALFAAANINVTKIESRPSRLRAWDYLFFADLDCHPEDPGVPEALAELQELTMFTKVLGAWAVPA